MKIFVSVSWKGRKVELPEPFPTVATVDRFIAQAEKKYGVPRSAYSVRVEDDIEDILRDGLALCKKLGIDTSFLA